MDQLFGRECSLERRVGSETWDSLLHMGEAYLVLKQKCLYEGQSWNPRGRVGRDLSNCMYSACGSVTDGMGRQRPVLWYLTPKVICCLYCVATAEVSKSTSGWILIFYKWEREVIGYSLWRLWHEKLLSSLDQNCLHVMTLRQIPNIWGLKVTLIDIERTKALSEDKGRLFLFQLLISLPYCDHTNLSASLHTHAVIGL